jgi:hypothetical protein
MQCRGTPLEDRLLGIFAPMPKAIQFGGSGLTRLISFEAGVVLVYVTAQP